ncbi:hypothetical protein IL306_010624 [Fusarium sp. DS 682]|nr:hypothetical protein IL306_010624 [Fusarium sp. DS 682]
MAITYLHGGPGGPTSPDNTKFFNPAVYRVVLMDQRGVGKSLPRNELRQNTTQHLSDDIEELREHLGISKWHMVFGGSWGSTLGLFYTQAHPERVGSLVVGGVLTGRTSELLCGKKPVAAQFFPEQWDAFLGLLTNEERQDPLGSYYARITSPDPDVSAAAARQWNGWGFSVCQLKPSTTVPEKLNDPDWNFTHALFEAHYLFQNGSWLKEGQLLDPENIAKMKHIPGKGLSFLFFRYLTYEQQAQLSKDVMMFSVHL